MFRTVRLLRMAKAPVLSSHLAEQIRSEEWLLAAQIFKLMVLLLIVAHFTACVWYGIGDSDDGEGWVAKSNVWDGGLASKYISSLHWSLSMFVGETLIISERLQEQCFAVAILFFGFMFSSVIVGSLTTAMTRLQLLSSQQAAQQAQLRRYLVNKGISRPLAVRVQRNAQHAMLEQKRTMPESSIDLLQIISEPLKVEIHFEVYSRLLLEHPFFYCFNEINPTGIRKVCNQCVYPQSLSVGDVLFSDLEAPTNPRMFFIEKGTTQYKQESRALLIKFVEHKEWLCEQVLWTPWTHCGSLQAVTETRLLALDAKKFQSLLSGAHDAHISRYAEAYVSVLNELGKDGLTDVGCVNEDMDDIIAYAYPEMVPEDEEEPDTNLVRENSWRGVVNERRVSGSSNSSGARGHGSVLRIEGDGSFILRKRHVHSEILRKKTLTRDHFASWLCAHCVQALVFCRCMNHRRTDGTDRISVHALHEGSVLHQKSSSHQRHDKVVPAGVLPASPTSTSDSAQEAKPVQLADVLPEPAVESLAANSTKT